MILSMLFITNRAVIEDTGGWCFPPKTLMINVMLFFAVVVGMDGDLTKMVVAGWYNLLYKVYSSKGSNLDYESKLCSEETQSGI